MMQRTNTKLQIFSLYSTSTLLLNAYYHNYEISGNYIPQAYLADNVVWCDCYCKCDEQNLKGDCEKITTTEVNHTATVQCMSGTYRISSEDGTYSLAQTQHSIQHNFWKPSNQNTKVEMWHRILKTAFSRVLPNIFQIVIIYKPYVTPLRKHADMSMELSVKGYFTLA